jgi:hypothetical protein
MRKAEYRRQWWPGEDETRRGLPLRLQAGGEFNAGDAPLSRQPLVHITSSVGPPNCRASDEYWVEVFHLEASEHSIGASAHVPCGKFTVTNVSPGQYGITASGPGSLRGKKVSVQIQGS